MQIFLSKQQSLPLGLIGSTVKVVRNMSEPMGTVGHILKNIIDRDQKNMGEAVILLRTIRRHGNIWETPHEHCR
jgi:hypothetical protein